MKVSERESNQRCDNWPSHELACGRKEMVIHTIECEWGKYMVLICTHCLNRVFIEEEKT